LCGDSAEEKLMELNWEKRGRRNPRKSSYIEESEWNWNCVRALSHYYYQSREKKLSLRMTQDTRGFSHCTKILRM
jgi:hypothetical protein